MRPLDRVEQREDQRDIGRVVAAPAAYGRLALGGRSGRIGRGVAVLGVRAALLAATEMSGKENHLRSNEIHLQ